MPIFDISNLQTVYGETLPRSVSNAVNQIQNIFSDRLSYLKQVKFHANFSLDEDTALAMSEGFVTKGLLVVADPSLPLVPEDVAWLPSQMYRGRTVFEIPEGQNVDLSVSLASLNSSVGVYETRYVDEIGIDNTDRFLVVDSAADDVVRPMHEQWLLGDVATLGKAYKQLTSNKVNGMSILEHSRVQRQKLAESILGSASSIYNDEMNALFSNQEHIFVANALVKQEGHVLQRMSALGGLMEIQDPATQFVAADQPTSLEGFQGWENMSDPHLRRIFQDCSWDGDEAFNTQILAKSKWDRQQIKRVLDMYGSSASATAWHMKKAKFSSQGIRDILPAEMLMKLTPVERPSFAPSASRAGDTLSIPIDPSYGLFQKVMSQPDQWGAWKPFNDAVLDGNYLKIPRDLIERI